MYGLITWFYSLAILMMGTYEVYFFSIGLFNAPVDAWKKLNAVYKSADFRSEVTILYSSGYLYSETIILF